MSLSCSSMSCSAAVGWNPESTCRTSNCSTANLARWEFRDDRFFISLPLKSLLLRSELGRRAADCNGPRWTRQVNFQAREDEMKVARVPSCVPRVARRGRRRKALLIEYLRHAGGQGFRIAAEPQPNRKPHATTARQPRALAHCHHFADR